MSVGVTLINPKFPHNVGMTIRAMSCFQEQGTVLWTGERFDLEKIDRLPREERMKGYASVEWRKATPKPIDEFPGFTPVCVELSPNAQPLHEFEHPENALYVFGPEDGSVPKGIRTACHQFVVVPTRHCLNLAAAVYITLYDRAVKRHQAGVEDMPELHEERGYYTLPFD